MNRVQKHGDLLRGPLDSTQQVPAVGESPSQ